MSRLTSRKESDLHPQTLDALAPVRVNGNLSPVYLQFASSEPALRAYLHMEKCLREGSLTEREVEAVKLWVSQHTGCDYCLSVHTYKAGIAGISADEQQRLRSGKAIDDKRVDTLIALASILFKSAGALPDPVLQQARDAGLSDENLVDLTMLISTIFFTNITNHINDSQSAWPPAPDLID